MSRSPVTDYRADIASNKEIIFIFIVFATVLYFIYPSDILKEQAMKEKSNYALSTIYLENMLQLDPHNEELLFAAVAADLGSGKVDLAKNLIGVLTESLKPKDRYKLSLLQYKIYMIDLQAVGDQNQSNKIKKKMEKLINKVSQSGEFQEKNSFLRYRYALALAQKEAALSFIKPIYENGDKYALEQCVYLANDLNKTQEKIYCTEQLVKADHNQSKKWLESAYIIYTESKNTKLAYATLKKLAQKDPKYLDELARVELREKDYEESSKTFIFLYEHSLDKDKKDYYLLKAIQVLIDGNKIDNAVALMKQYEDIYLKDDEMMNIFIKRYLGMERLRDAQDLSLKLMKDGSFE